MAVEMREHLKEEEEIGILNDLTAHSALLLYSRLFD